MAMPTAPFLTNPLTRQGFALKRHTLIDQLTVSTRRAAGVPARRDTLTITKKVQIPRALSRANRWVAATFGFLFAVRSPI
jgi:hypothetical protein